MKTIFKHFLQGLLVFVPVVGSIWLVWMMSEIGSTGVTTR
jgi:uncharacterized membrane protein